MNEAYLPTTLDGMLWRLVEEMGEVQQVLGKTGRFGILSRHPDGGPTNVERLSDELDDLIHAAMAARLAIQPLLPDRPDPFKAWMKSDLPGLPPDFEIP